MAKDKTDGLYERIMQSPSMNPGLLTLISEYANTVGKKAELEGAKTALIYMATEGNREVEHNLRRIRETQQRDDQGKIDGEKEKAVVGEIAADVLEGGKMFLYGSGG